MPSPHRTAAGLHRIEKSGGLPTADAADFEYAARGGNRMLKILDAADGIEVLHAAKCNLEELRRGAGLNQLQIAHLPHPPTCKEATRSSLQPHCRRHLAVKRLPRRLCRDVRRLLDLLRLRVLILDLLDADAPIENPFGE
jgi:hypothetical protein